MRSLQTSADLKITSALESNTVLLSVAVWNISVVIVVLII